MRGLYIRRRKSSRNSESSVPDQSLMYERFRKAKIDLALNFCRIHEQAKKIPNHETDHVEANIQRLRNVVGTGTR